MTFPTPTRSNVRSSSNAPPLTEPLKLNETTTGATATNNITDSDESQSPPPSTTSVTASSDSSSLTSGTTPCSRGPKCVQRTVSMESSEGDNGVPMPPRFLALQGMAPPPATTTRPDKKVSCVDCGGCLCCCDCHEAQAENEGVSDLEANTTTTTDQQPRAHSIKLGKVKAQMIEDLFADPSKGLSSQALTAPMQSATMSCNNSKSLVVRKVQEEEPSESRLFASSEDDPNETPHLPRTTEFGGGCGGHWANCIHKIHLVVTKGLRWITLKAATNPKRTVGGIIFFSLAMLLIGCFTNFQLEVENWYLWPPTSSLSIQHTQWFYYESEFNYDTSYFDMIVHARGDNVLGQEGVRRTFEAITAIQELEGYQQGCYWAELFGDENYVGECKIHSVADFWNESLAIFEEQVETDYDAKVAMSAAVYPNGVYVDEPRILGKAERVSDYGADDDTYTRLESAESYLIEFDLPWTNVTAEFEWRCLERIQQLQQEWDADPNNMFTIEFNSQRSFGDEFFRAIIKDLPLLPCVFVIMSAFCCFVFWKRDRVQSRMSLGVGAVVCILLSVLTGYGILFTFGVPFTTVTTMMPFLMFGVGLDDAFIIYGSYNRTDRRLDPVERIMITVDDVGVSITLTTVTSTLAFILGVFSSIPAVSWVCQYAWVTILVDFIYQITFFMALIVLDERRIADNRLDVCICSKRPTDGGLSEGETFEDTESQSPTKVQTSSSTTGSETEEITKAPAPQKVVAKARRQSRKIQKIDEKAHFADRFMYWFAKKLLIPKVQVGVIILFLVVLMGSVCCATRLRQQFNYVDMVPDDSYMKDFHQAQSDYTVRSGLYTYVFFRDVDQSDPVIQDEMMAYVDDLTNSRAIDHYPVYFWLRDFKQYAADNNATLGNKTFEAQLAEFFKDPSWEDLYGEHVVVDEDGGVTQSRCVAFVDVDMQDTKAGTAMLDEMRAVDSRQPINHDGRDRWAFLSYSDDYHILEFYNAVVEELIMTTIMGVVAVSVIAIFFIPHWTAVFFVFPFISFLYIDMLGFLYLAGVQVNAISYITLVMSIGLMVDFIMHILLRYYESNGTREQRVVETLSTMGASILVGAISTFLGVLLLVFSTSEIITNIFVAFIGLVTFGVMHGLIFLPTLLAMVGPE